jgi:hypothetical protein
MQMTEIGENDQIHATHSQDWLVEEQKATRQWSIPPSIQDYNNGTVGELDVRLLIGVLFNTEMNHHIGMKFILFRARISTQINSCRKDVENYTSNFPGKGKVVHVL